MNKIKYYIYRFQWWISQYIYIKPIHLDLELTNRCNQKCITCWHSGTPSFKLGDMDFVLADNLISEYARKGYKSIKFNLRGEPMVYKYILPRILWAKNCGYVDLMINSNGVLITPEVFDSLKKHGLTTLIISVDAFTHATYEELHGVSLNQYLRLKQNIDYIRTAKGNMRVVLNFHVNTINRREVNEFRRLYEKDFILNITGTMNREGAHISEFKPKRSWPMKSRKKICPHMMRRTAVLVNGKTYPCCVCYNEPDDILIKNEHDRKVLIDNYKKGIYTDSCKYCTSGEIWKK
jgi:MoaA/NifB/PqqE/SkfB family radical SAM enzyme